MFRYLSLPIDGMIDGVEKADGWWFCDTDGCKRAATARYRDNGDPIFDVKCPDHPHARVGLVRQVTEH